MATEKGNTPDSNPKPNTKPRTKKAKPVPPGEGEPKSTENNPPTDVIEDTNVGGEPKADEIIGGEPKEIEQQLPPDLTPEELEEINPKSTESKPPLEVVTPEVVEDENKAAGSSFGITLNFRKESESKHVQSIINELVKHGVVTDKSDFAKKCIDFCINHNAVIRELVEKKKGYPSPLQFPYPDGTDGSFLIEPKLLSKSLFEGAVDIPMCK